jgi:hypothetical protein
VRTDRRYRAAGAELPTSSIRPKGQREEEAERKRAGGAARVSRLGLYSIDGLIAQSCASEQVEQLALCATKVHIACRTKNRRSVVRRCCRSLLGGKTARMSDVLLLDADPSEDGASSRERVGK